MPLQILNEITPGERFSQALSTGLQGLAQGKLQQLQNQDQSRALQMLANPNIPQEQKAQFVSALPPELQQEYFKQEMKRPQREAIAQAINQFAQGSQGGNQIGQKEMPDLSQLDPKEAMDLIKMYQKDTQISDANKRYIDQYARDINKDEISRIKQDYNAFKKLDKVLDEALDLAVDPKTGFGPFQQRGKYFSPQNTSRLNDLSARAVNVFAENLKGRPTDKRMELLAQEKFETQGTRENNIKKIAAMRNQGLESMAEKMAHDSILSENKGFYPEDFNRQVEEKAAKYYDDLLTKEIKNILSRDLPYSWEKAALTPTAEKYIDEFPLKFPEAYQKNTVIEENGVMYKLVSKNGKSKWKPIKE
jgi:hypothetical protein